MSNGTRNVNRRTVLALIAAGGISLTAGRTHASTPPAVTVWKDANCSCCGGWVEHLRRNGFAVIVIEMSNVQSVKTQRGVPAELTSCHTAAIAGYTIEGHVPAVAILRLIAEKPAGRGLAVPGMPIGSPGMEGGTPEAYHVMLFGDGPPKSFARFVGERAA